MADELWSADGPVNPFSYVGVSLPFPTQMKIVRLESGEHSPTELTPGLEDEVTRSDPCAT